MGKVIVNTQKEAEEILKKSPGYVDLTFFTITDIVLMLRGRFVTYAQEGMEYYEAYGLDPDDLARLENFEIVSTNGR